MWLDVIKMFVTIAQHKRETDQTQKDRVSKMYSQMSELLVDAAKDLAQDVYPQGKCAAMWSLSQNVLNYLEDKLNPEELDMLHKMLHSCSQLEREYATRKDGEIIKKLFEAAGQLQSLSILYSI